MDYHVDFSIILTTYPVLLRGLLVTFELWAVCFPIALLLGLIVASGRLSESSILRAIALVYTEVFRDVPALIQLIWFYYAFPIVIGIQLTPFAAAVLGIALNNSAYCTELFRGGIQSLSKGQWEGAKALGMRRSAALRRIILPQVFKRMLPAFTNRGIELAKTTSLASVLTVHELMDAGRLLNATYYRPLEVFTTVAFVYFFLIYPGSLLSARLERHMARTSK
jgi:polar amino acid transport system permease protein